MDTNKLITLVRANPVLYCTTHPHYMRTKFKDELWESIGEKLNSDGCTVKEQWQKLRDCHREALRRQKKRKRVPHADPPKTWIYQKQMEFLIPFMRNSRSYNLDNTPSGDSPKEERSEDPGSDLDIKQSVEIKGSDDEQKPVILEWPQNEQSCRLSPIQQCPTEYGYEANEPRQEFIQLNSNSERDALHDFFMAMYSTTKQLPGSFQRRIKKEMFRIISEAEEEYETTRLN